MTGVMDRQPDRAVQRSWLLRIPFTFLLLAATHTSGVTQNPTASPDAQNANPQFETIVSGIRINVTEGAVSYEGKEGTFELMNDLALEEGDRIVSGTEGRAELILQPGNYLRVGAETHCRLLGKQYDRIKLQLDRGSLSLELLRTKDGNPTPFSGPFEQPYDLLRIMAAHSEVLIAEPGVFRVDVDADAVIRLKVIDGQAFIDGRRVKERESAVVSKGQVEIVKFDPRVEDRFDTWCRERAEKLVKANRSLKNEAPWTNKRKEDEEPTVDLPSQVEQSSSQYVVSAKPASVTFVEPGVQIRSPQHEWAEATQSTSATAGDHVRTSADTRAEFMLLPDIFLRVDGDSEIGFEQLSDDVIAVRLLRGAAIVDAARFDRKQLPTLSLAGGTRSFIITEAGNYRIDIRSGIEELTVRKGRVMSSGRSIGSCRRIVNGVESSCGKRLNDNFDYWSTYRGEGEAFNGKPAVTYLLQIRQRRFKSTGFWYRHQRVGYYTFVPFWFDGFESPYGGDYSTVLSRRHGPGLGPRWRNIPEIPRIDLALSSL